MRQKLQKFTDFANSLLPHETAFLLHEQQFQDATRLNILKAIDENCQNIQPIHEFDEQIDKRKYSHLKNWIEEKLESVDIDAFYDKITLLQKHIATDSISLEEEQYLLRQIQVFEPKKTYFFCQFYETLVQYRQFLLIRLRMQTYHSINDFLQKYQPKYAYSKQVEEKIQQITVDIAQQYLKGSPVSETYEQWLSDCFYDEDLDGMNRYGALVRLTFIYNNYRKFDKLKAKYDFIDHFFKQGVYYSKRVLVNYYGNRLLLHTRFNELKLAEYYGYLSIRFVNNDYLLYVNNLCSILLRQHKYDEALQLMRKAHPEMKKTPNLHNRIGFMAFYSKSLNFNGLHKNAESYVDAFLKVYKNEIFEHRWHLFFTAYMESMIGQKKYFKTLEVIKKYHLLEKEEEYHQKHAYTPSIKLYNTLSLLKDNQLGLKEFTQILVTEKQKFQALPERQHHFNELMANINQHLTTDERAFVVRKL